MTAPTAPKNHSLALDVVRGVAATMVVLGHVRGDLYNSVSLDPAASGITRLLLLPTSFAQEAVAVFFVLSGYLVGGSVLRDVHRGTFTWSVYLAKRLSRLWTVLLPGLALTFVADWLTRRIHGDGYLLTHPPEWSTAAIAACNAAFLNPLQCRNYGSNVALWSLSYEFWFYILFAAVTVAIYGAVRGHWVRAGAALIAAVGCVVVFGPHVLVLIPAWLLGVVVAHVRARPGRLHQRLTAQPQPWQWPAASALVAAAALAANLTHPPEAVVYLLVGAATVPLLLVCVASSGTARPSRLVRFGAWVGTISFSVYVFHRPLVILSVGYLGEVAFSGTIAAVVTVYALTGLLIAGIYPLYLLTERHTPRVRDALLRGLRRPRVLTR